MTVFLILFPCSGFVWPPLQPILRVTSEWVLPLRVPAGSGHPCTLFLISLISFASAVSDPSDVTTPSFRGGLSSPRAPELSIPVHGLPLH